MLIRFIAHAGVYIEEGEHSILIDPWFRGSSFEMPVLQSITGEHKTIDFQIPPTSENIDDYVPDVILVSHFHTHHSPKDDILKLAKQKKQVVFGYPEHGSEKVKKAFSRYKNVETIPFDDEDSITIGGIEIIGMHHTVDGHMMWFIKSVTGSILHIADARANRNPNLRVPDVLWRKVAALKPDVVFLSAGGNTLRIDGERGEKQIFEGAIMTPIEAAHLMALLKPKVASVIGCYNKSMWGTLNEYVLPSNIIEEAFSWGVSWISPQTQTLLLRPGVTLSVGDSSLLGKVDKFV